MLSLFGQVLDIFGSTYEWFEELPGRTRFLSGVAFFLLSIYFGETLKSALDSLAAATIIPALGNFVRFPFSIRVVLLLLVILSVQSALINYRSSRINYRLITLEGKLEQSMQTAGETATDGGQHHSRGAPDGDVESSGAGALGGAAAGAAIGASFGPGGVLGGAILGAIVGDEVEKSSTRSREKKERKAKIVRTLRNKRSSGSSPYSVESILGWFPADDPDRIGSLVEELVAEPRAPVEKTRNGKVYLTNHEEATVYLEELGEQRSENW